METKEEIKEIIPKMINELLESDKDKYWGLQTLGDGYAEKIDDDIRLLLHWESGFGEEPRTDVIQSTKNPDYALCWKLVKRNKLSSKVNHWEDLWDDLTDSNSVMPNYKDNLDVWSQVLQETCGRIRKGISKSQIEQFEQEF